MYDRMIGYLEKFLILHNNRFGFRLKHSTTQAFNAVDHKISFRRFLSYLSNRKQCVSLLGTNGSD